MSLIYQALRAALGRCRLPVKLQNPLHSVIPTRLWLRHLATSNDSSSSNESDNRDQPVSFLQSKAATYRINEVDTKDWSRRQRIYKYLILPLSITFLTYLMYMFFFAKPEEDNLTEEQLLRLLEAFEETEEKKTSKEAGKPTTM